MMQVYFHLGAAKTGSSALQHALFNSYEYLESNGVLYPRDPIVPTARSHRVFATRVAPLDKLPRHMMTVFQDQTTADARFQAFHTDLRDRIRENPPRLLLMSAETMFARIKPANKPRLRAAIDSLGGPILFMAYLRRPSERYASELQQVARRAARILQPRHYSYRENILRYEALFGKGCLRTHLFHSSALRDGDVVTDFCERYLRDFGIDQARLSRGGSGNLSLSAEATSIMLAYRRDFDAERENQRTPVSEALLKWLGKADKAIKGTKIRLRPEIAEQVDYSSDDPLWLRDHHGIAFPDFDYRRLERREVLKPSPRITDLGEIISIDGAIRQATLEWLMASGWGAKRRRRAWLRELAATPL